MKTPASLFRWLAAGLCLGLGGLAGWLGAVVDVQAAAIGAALLAGLLGCVGVFGVLGRVPLRVAAGVPLVCAGAWLVAMFTWPGVVLGLLLRFEPADLAWTGRWTAYQPPLQAAFEGVYRGGVPHGFFRYFAGGGRVESEGRFESGQREGVWRHWYPLEGTLQETLEYRGGRLQGVQVGWHPSGTKAWEHRCVDGRIEGPDAAWYPSGQKEWEGRYRLGGEDGAWTWWYEDGTKREEGRYVQGVRVGRWTRWYEAGKAEALYVGGEIPGGWRYWDRDGEKTPTVRGRTYEHGVAGIRVTFPPGWVSWQGMMGGVARNAEIHALLFVEIDEGPYHRGEPTPSGVTRSEMERSRARDRGLEYTGEESIEVAGVKVAWLRCVGTDERGGTLFSRSAAFYHRTRLLRLRISGPTDSEAHLQEDVRAILGSVEFR